MIVSCKKALQFLNHAANGRLATILIVYSCSNRCIFCGPYNKSLDAGGSAMPLKEVLAWVEKCKENNVDTIVLSGAGDPLTHPDVVQVIEAIHSRNMNPYCFTSAKGVSAAAARDLRKAGLNSALVSVHGFDSNTHDLATATPGSFLKTLQGLDNLRSADISLQTNTVLTTVIEGQLDKLASFLSCELEIRDIAFSYPQIEGRAAECPEMIPRFENIAEELQDQIVQLRNNGALVTVENIPFCYIDPQSYIGMPDVEVLYMDKEYDICTKASQVGFVYRSFCSDCNMRPECPGIDAAYPFELRKGASTAIIPS